MRPQAAVDAGTQPPVPDELATARAKSSNVPYAVLYAPIIAGDRVLGVLGVNNAAATSEAFTEQDGALLSALADYVAIAVENADAYERLARATGESE